MNSSFTFPSLWSLLSTVFAPRAEEGDLTLFVDLPTNAVPDTPAWKDRRRLAAEVFFLLQAHIAELPFRAVNFCTYDNVGSNNNDLPEDVMLIDTVSKTSGGSISHAEPLTAVLSGSSIVLALTELSATAPLKLLARSFEFRGATLPGFTRAMVPALGLDYEAVQRRVMQFKERLDRATGAVLTITGPARTYTTSLDLRFRTAHASGGLMRERGMVANLPSGEAYIVPFEGDRAHGVSKSSGILPVQFGQEIVEFRVAENRACEVLSTGPASESQRRLLAEEPAYGNIAELGLGVLGEWGVEAVGSTLLDEKLGVHVAFGRSDHFGGSTSPASFKNPHNVVHIDWVYVPSVQPSLSFRDLTLCYEGGGEEMIVKNSKYIV
jgi:hypothetical protein